MSPNRSRFAVAMLAALVSLAAAGCSDDDGDKTTNPPTLELNSGVIAQSGTFSHRFFTAATFPYHCTIHPSMTAAVIVSDAAPAADTSLTVQITGLAFTPASITLHTGGQVTWTNLDPTNHTVTSN